MDGRTIGVWGAGAMGAGIARAFAAAGRTVLMTDADREQAPRARGRILEAVARRDPAAAEEMAQRLRTVDDPRAFTDCALVVEAVFEEPAIKRGALEAMETAGVSGVIASNTSSLSIEALAGALRRPERFLGMHFFVPAHANPLVEVTPHARTGPDTVGVALALCAEIGKSALLSRDAPGFITNRFYLPLCNEAIRLAQEGAASPAQIEAAARQAFGLPIGPFAVCRMGKLRTTLSSIEGLAGLGAFYAPAEDLRTRAATEDHWVVDPQDPEAPARPELVARLQGAVFLSVLQAIDDGVAEPSSFDRAAALGLKFAAPPCAGMDALGPEAVAELIGPLLSTYQTAPPASLARVGALTSENAR